MPISYMVVSDGDFVSTTGHGRLTADELMVYLRALLDDPNVPVPIRDLHDLSRVDEFQISAQDVERVLQLSLRNPARIREGRVAVIAPQDHVYGMSRMLQMLAEHAPTIEQLRQQGLAPEVAVFRTHAPAKEWLLSTSEPAA